MGISAPDALTIDNSGKYILSIRLRPGGLSISGYIPSGPGSFFIRDIKFDSGISYISSLKELFFSNEMFTWNYRAVNILIMSPQYTMIPSSIFEEKKAEKILSFNFSVPETHALTNIFKEEQATILFGIEKEVYEFCTRSFIDPAFLHYMTPKVRLWSNISTGKRMYASNHDKFTDIICYDDNKLIFSNTFHTVQVEDILYYILHVWRQIEFDQEKDQLFFDGENERHRIAELLRTYIRCVTLSDIPSEAYLLGTSIKQAPTDIIALALCGL